jgi:hypothetical protein
LRKRAIDYGPNFFFHFCSTILEKDSMKQQKIAREDEKQEDTKKGFIPLLLG